MADLLECLLQVRALAETPGRLADLVRRAPVERWVLRPESGAPAPVELLGRMVEVELRETARLGAILASDRPFLAEVDSVNPAVPGFRDKELASRPDMVLERFRVRRSCTLALLDDCTVDDFTRVGIHPSRGETTVADMVALLLARDLDLVGQIRESLGFSAPSLARVSES
jgi:hypothetical protein